MGALTFDDLVVQNQSGKQSNALTFDDLVQPKRLTLGDVGGTTREMLQDMPWGERNKYALGMAIAKGYEGVKGLLGGQVDPSVSKIQAVSEEEAPVGSIVGEVTKYAPAIAATAALPAAAIAGGLGFAYEPGSAEDRAIAGGKDAALSLAGSGLVKGLSKAGEWAMRQTPTQRTVKALKEIIGERNIPRAVGMARNAGNDVRTAQALDELDNPTLAAMDKAAKSNPVITADIAQEISDRTARQEIARQAKLDSLTGGNTSAGIIESRNILSKGIEKTLGPEREFLLDVANVGAEGTSLLKKAAQLRAQASALLNTPTSPTKAYALQRQAADLESKAGDIAAGGFVPLETKNIQSTISSIKKNPDLGASDNVSNVLSDVGRQIQSWVGKGGGTIDSRALYMKRKTAVNETVDRLLAGTDPISSKKLAAKLSVDVRSAIDDSLESSAPGWKAFLGKYSDELKEIDKLELLAKARDLYKSGDKKGFMNLVKNEDPDTVRKIMSSDFNIEKALPSTGIKGPNNQFATLDKVANEVGRDIRLADLAGKPEGQAALANIISKDTFQFHLPSFLNRYVMIANTAVKSGEMKMNKAVFKNIEKAMRDPQEFARLIVQLPPKQQSKMLQYMDKLAVPAGVGTVSVANASNE